MPSWEHFSHDADIGLVGIGTGGGGQGRDLDRSERCARGRWMARDVCREQVSNVATLPAFSVAAAGRDGHPRIRQPLSRRAARRRDLYAPVRQAFADVPPPAHLTQFYDVPHNTCNLEEHPGDGASKSVGVRQGGSYAEKLR
jgi:hypothetical protein